LVVCWLSVVVFWLFQGLQELLKDAYPDRLVQLMAVNVNVAVRGAYSMLKPFMSPRLQRKVMSL
jgi:hypothetical protein